MYCLRPVHKKKQGPADSTIPLNNDPANNQKAKLQPMTEEDQQQCDPVAQLLEGKGGGGPSASCEEPRLGYGHGLSMVLVGG